MRSGSQEVASRDLPPVSNHQDFLLRVVGVSLYYRGNRHFRLEDVSFDLRRGDFLGLVGANGSGKSTLLKALLGLVRPFRGSIEWASPRPRIGYVPQSEQIDPAWPMRVRDLLELTGSLAYPLFCEKSRLFSQIEGAMEMVGVSHLGNRLLENLSGGELQRVLLARALVLDPEVVLLDEPTAAMDLIASESFLFLVQKLRRKGKLTLILISHDLNILAKRANRLGIIAGGRFISGYPEELLESSALSRAFGRKIKVDWTGEVLNIVPEREEGKKRDV